MALVRGSVTVADNEVASGSGYAFSLYNEIKAVEEANQPLPSLAPPDDWSGEEQDWVDEIKPIRLRILRAWAREATRHSIVITFLTSNAQLRVTTGDAGLQRDADTLNASIAPLANKTFGSIV